MNHRNYPTDRWGYLIDVGMWPKRAQFDPNAWMQNFTDLEVPYALRLLEGFTYFSKELTEQMFRSAFLTISQTLPTNKANYALAQANWSSFVDSLIVVRVTGEMPNDSDSGFTFARLAREVLDIPEERIIAPESAIELLLLGKPYNILFVDDFVGSGNQFCDTWERKYQIGQYNLSFKDVNALRQSQNRFIYCPVICTEKGKDQIHMRCPDVQIMPAHFFGSKQSALSDDSEIWRNDMRTDGPLFVKIASERAGIPDLKGGVGCWRGFHCLGLAVAFQHYWPDATLPLFSWAANGWKPLLRKGVI